ncbi:MAG: polyribonucleotide nucleotidyltransferase [Candidatus Bipolaricaulota bacterium]|nr:polyribonucleotide nucleotidyltransferase [Candidatus Bipolaricaulota bacterium]MDW8031203.1 polyribonucleotide nucleotidyltransferase [Candidatus Bipolaricaulota bacterium]
MTEVVEVQRGPWKLSTGKVARQADAAVLVEYGETVVLVTVTRGEAEDLDYFPLTVDFEEKFYATGKIPGGFLKREGKPSEAAILSARMIDRPIRPLFPPNYREKVHIVATVLSADNEHCPSIAGLLGASAALMISGAPFLGPIAGVRVGRIKGELIANPSDAELQQSDMDIVVAGNKEKILMVEGAMKEVPEDQVLEALAFAQGEIRHLIALQEEFLAKLPPREKVQPKPPPDTSELREALKSLVWDRFESLRGPMRKLEREAKADAIRDEAIEKILAEKQAVGVTDPSELEKLKEQLTEIFTELLEEFVRVSTLTTKIRMDGRRADELRPIWCEVGILPRVHGSALFTRGETQSLGTVTLGTSSLDEQIIDRMLEEGRERFMLHYNFPPYSVGEAGRMGPPGRREIGHGNLAKNAMKAVIPSEDEFPYIIRVVSEILESNGSSSMATVCSSSLALMDAGVPIKKPVAGIAMGLLTHDSDYMILTDLAGYEDHFGDMDFKLAGTRDGLTGFQLDVKIHGITLQIAKEAMEQARAARLQILDIMEKTLPAPRPTLSRYAPILEVLPIDPEKIGLVIGPGGKTIRAIQAETNTEIDIDDEKNVVKIAGRSTEMVRKARERIEQLTEDIEVGNRYSGKVVRIEKFGAFVELPNGMQGLIRLADLSDRPVRKVEDVVKIGDVVTVEVIEVDELNRINLKLVRDTPPSQAIKVGDILVGKIVGIADYGAFVETEAGVRGLIHISQLADGYVERVEDVVKVGETVLVQVVRIDKEGRYSFKRLGREGLRIRT